MSRSPHGLLQSVLKRKHLFGETVWVLLGQALFVIGGLVSVKVTTHFINPRDMGAYSMALTITSLATDSLLSGPSDAARRFYAAAAEKNSARSFLRAIRIVMQQRLIWFGPLMLAGLAIVGVVGTREWFVLSLGVVAGAILHAFNCIPQEIHLATRQRIIHAAQQALRTWANVGFLIVMVPVFGANSGVALWSVLASTAAITGLQWFFFRRMILARIPAEDVVTEQAVTEWRTDLFAYALPFVFWGLPNWFQSFSNRIALERFASMEVVGQSSVLQTVGALPILIMLTVFTQLLTPFIFGRAGDSSDPERVKSAGRLVGLFVLATGTFIGLYVTATFLFHQQIFHLLTDQKYWPYSHYLPLAALAGGLFGLANALAVRILAGKDSKKLVWPRIVSALCGTVFNIVGTYKYGLVGSIWAGIAAGALTLILTKIAADKDSKAVLAVEEEATQEVPE